jgi:excisionase family DNA binding protein
VQRLLTIDEVSDLLGVPVRTLYRWRQIGYGPTAGRIGKHLRYRADDVEAFVARRFGEEAAADVHA